jgi:hypothetical protein
MATEKVSGYNTKEGKHVPTYKRKAKPKKHENIRYEMYEVKVARDDEGRIFGPRKYKRS